MLWYEVQPNRLLDPHIDENVFSGLFGAGIVLLPVGEFPELYSVIFENLNRTSQMGRLYSCFVLYRLVPHMPILHDYFTMYIQKMDSLMLEYEEDSPSDGNKIVIDVKIPIWATRVFIRVLLHLATPSDLPNISRTVSRISTVLRRAFWDLSSDGLVGLLLKDLVSLAQEKAWLFHSAFGVLMKLILITCAKYIGEEHTHIGEDGALGTDHRVVTYDTILRSLFFLAIVARRSPQVVLPHVAKLANYFEELSRCDDVYVRWTTSSILFPLGLVAFDDTDPLRQLHRTVSASTGGILMDHYAQVGTRMHGSFEDIPDSLSGT